MPFIKGMGMNIAKNSNTPFYERFGAEMYRSKKNVYQTSNSTNVKYAAQAPVKSYSAAIDDESGEGVSMEYVKSEVNTTVIEEDNFTDKDAKGGMKLDFNSDSILNGIILSEILGKPVSKRRSRW